MHSYKILIREFHMDTFGHVNNATYLALYEEARWDLITGNNYGWHRIQELKQGPVVLDVTIKWLKEIHLREQITITTELVDYKGKVGHLKQRMLREDGTVCSEALFTFALFDLKVRKLIDPTPDWLRAVESK